MSTAPERDNNISRNELNQKKGNSLIIMTSSMIITLLVVIGMIVVIISDKLPFGAPALLACALLVVLGQADVATAFSGFVDKNVIMVMGFMAATAVLQKTEVIFKLKNWLRKVAATGGIRGFMTLIIAIMLCANIIGGTAYYVLIITLISQIPYNKEMPTSRILLPAALASGASAWLPNRVAMPMAMMSSLIEKGGYTGPMTLTISKICLTNIIWSVIYLTYAFVMYRFLPDRDISDINDQRSNSNDQKFEKSLTDGQQKLVYVLYIILLVSMIFLRQIPGDIGYGIPLIIGGIYLAVGCISFKEFILNMFSPVMIMMASVIGIAGAMANCGLSDYLGGQIASVLGGNPSLIVLIIVFSFLTSLMSTFTGASIGSMFIFVPIGIAICMQYGYNPLPLVFACQCSAFANYWMPIDGMPAMVLGIGKYKLTEFWLYTIPLWIIQVLFKDFIGIALFG